ncbi:MAG: glycoside hydrolase family 140 protein [Janthinobacterium lividum]
MNLLPRLRVSDRNPHLLADESGQSFFLLGDTAWELFHRLTLTEADFYFANRAAKGFNLMCAVVLSEFDGLRVPNANGDLPLHDSDPRRPNEAYFADVDAKIEMAAAHGLYIGLLPTWGDKLTAPWGEGPRIFPDNDPDAARDYGLWLGRRYKDATNLLWILGGDRPPRLDKLPRSWTFPWELGFTDATDWTPLWRGMAEGIREGTDGRALMTYHPQDGPVSTSQFLHEEPWLDINMMQSGHGKGHDVPVWDWIAHDYALAPIKPTLDSEPNYEDHPVNPWPVFRPENGYFRAYDVRKQCYRSVFAGGCGVIYGHHAVWQFWDETREKINHADRYWIEALDRPGAFQVSFLRRLLESRPGFGRIPDQSLLASNSGDGRAHISATRDADGKYALIYTPEARESLNVHLDKLAGPRVRAAWFDPRSGQETQVIGEYPAQGIQMFLPPETAQEEGSDWVLVLDSVAETA